MTALSLVLAVMGWLFISAGQTARAGLERFRTVDPIEVYADVLGFVQGYAGETAKRLDTGPWRPTLVNLGSGKDYHAGWLNLDIVELSVSAAAQAP